MPPYQSSGIKHKRFISLVGFVQIRLGDDLHRRVHTQHRDAAVDHFHAVQRADIRDGSAAAQVDSAEFRRLPADFVVVHDPAELSHKLGVRVIGTALSAAACEFVEAYAPAKPGGVFLFKRGSI